MKKQIKIRVYPDGKISSETINIKGKKCLNYINDIEKLTNAKTVKSQFTDEYYQTEQVVDATVNIEYQNNEY